MTAIAEHAGDLFGLRHHHKHFIVIINQTFPWGEGDQVGITFYPSVDKKVVAFYLFVAWHGSARATHWTETSRRAESAPTTASCMMLRTDKYFQLRSTIICLSNGQIVLTKVLWSDPVVLAYTNWSLF